MGYGVDKKNIADIKQTMVMNNVYEITKRELVKFLHAAVGFPVVDTWVKAIWNMARFNISVGVQVSTKI